MSVPITQSIKDELNRPHPRFIRRLTLIKNLFNANTRVSTDITDRVTSWGSITLDTTAQSINWELPNVTVQCRNEDKFLSPFDDNSYFNTAPVTDPLLTFLLIEVSLQTDVEGTIEPILLFYGSVRNVSIVLDKTFNLVELTCIAAQSPGSNERLSVESGGRMEFLYIDWTP